MTKIVDSSNLCFLFLFLVSWHSSVVHAAQQTEQPTEPLKQYVPLAIDRGVEHFAFDSYQTLDKFGRTIDFYLSKSQSERRLPLVVCIQGSGCQSVFLEVDTPDGKRVVSGGPESAIMQSMRGKCRVLVVEKPGVLFKFQPKQPGSSLEGSEEFLREFSLPRWVEAVNSAVNACAKLDRVSDSRLLALGHSEGGQVACELAVTCPRVSHVAVMAGGGPTQLFDFIKFARSGDMYDPNATSEKRVEALMMDWQKVVGKPQATDQFILGHTHLRWSSFAKTSPVEAILKTKAKVFIAQGTDDKNSLPESADVLYAELLARGRDVTYERIEGADHAFMKDGERDGWLETNRKAVQWFLKN